MFQTAGHCCRDEVSRLVGLLQSREPRIPKERVVDVLKVCHAKKRDIEKVWSHGNIRVRAADKRYGKVTWQYH